jgi:hypothetical protein
MLLRTILEDLSLDSAAISKGYTIKDIYHGTSEKFTSFSHKAQKNVQAPDTHGVVYATDSENEARIIGHPASGKSVVMKLYGKMDRPFVVDAKGTSKERSFGKVGYGKLIKMAKEKGHDGAIIKNIVDFTETPQTTYIFFDTKNVKLAGPTVDDNRQPIPVEKRFDSSTDDLRF